ncbi:MAG: hypothetical protein Q8P48_08960, partial [Deltaproteobacteria bacterium]|nr:hypothetical protein [Deltaproteobacteria bacterium]
MRIMAMTTVSLMLSLVPALAFGYPNGTLQYVTDTAPFCASCHSSAKAGYMPELPPEQAEAELPENKHYGLVRMPSLPSPYAELAEAQKERIIRNAKKIDSLSSITLSAPSKAGAGGEVRVTVKAKGGNGPVICVMLVDRALRFQSRPVSSSGWEITGEPEIKGQDGKSQAGWLDKRAKGLARNLNFIIVDNQRFDLDKGVYPEGTVTYTLKAPSKPGRYTLA